jgi:hypothetical protein
METVSMVLNTFSLLSLFIGAISLFLMAGAPLLALHFYGQMKGAEGADVRALAESRIHLSLLLIFTAFLLRLATWPLFYIRLQSLIPLVPGAMCIFGVTRVMPAFVTFLQVLKPSAFFLVGGWLIFYGYDLSFKTRPLMEKSLRLLVWTAAIAGADAAAEILFILLFSPPGVAVSCCTAVGDIVAPSRTLLPVPLFSAHYHGILMAGYHGFNLGLAGLMGILVWRRRAGRPLLWLVALAALANGAVTYGAFKEYLGPRLMHLPDHHCLYCLLQYRPASILILGLFILGSFSAMWPLLLSRAITADEAVESLDSLNLNLLKCAIVCLLASWAMAVILS